jgi:uncharacterized membrane protein YdjX (TVP38/TMEM64 family)
MRPPLRSTFSAKLALVALVLAGLAAAYHAGVFAWVARPKTLADSLVAMGGWGYVLFILTYTLLQPFGAPGTVFVVAAPLIWPWQTAFALSMIGTMCASVIGFAFARFVARDWVSARIPAKLQTYQKPLEQNAFETVVLLRLIFWMPQALHFFLGVSAVRFWTHFWGSLVGYVPPLLVVSYFGNRVFDTAGNMRPDAWPILVSMLVGSLTLATAARAYARRRLAG